MKFSPIEPSLFICEDGDVFVHGVRKQSQFINSDGYYAFDFWLNGKKRQMRTHRFVASAYCKGYAPGLCVNHLDGNKLNNHYRNLEWVTLSENTRHAHATGLTKARGQDNGNCKLSHADVAAIRERIARGDGDSSIARDYGVTHTAIYDIKVGKRWRICELQEAAP